MPKDTAARSALHAASLAETAAIIAQVIAPTMAKGPLLRRETAVRVADRLDLDTRAVRRMETLAARHGGAALRLAIPGKTQILLLAPEDAARVLAGEPEPFTPASDEKRTALAHFEPRVSLASRGGDRARRRAFNEAVLEHDRAVHSQAEPLLAATADEARRLLDDAGDRLDHDGFKAGWDAFTRRIVLGAGARDDTGLMETLDDLRGNANWAFLHPGRKARLERFRARIAAHLDRAEPGSLAARIAAVPQDDRTAPEDQVAHYLFGWDGAAMAILRVLAVLARDPRALDRARADAADDPGRTRLPWLRAAVIESLRLWPTTPLIFRQSTEPTDWGGETVPEGAAFTIYVPYFHRNGAVPDADRFVPERWIGEDGAAAPVHPTLTLLPFSLGGGRCPASQLVPMLSAAFLAALLEARTPRLETKLDLGPDAPLPGTLDHFALRFRLAPR